MLIRVNGAYSSMSGAPIAALVGQTVDSGPTPANTTTVAAFLAALGLEQWLSVFEEEEVELSLLPDITGADLEGMNVPLGARLKILAAAKRFTS
jgi:hypothetical protein